MRAIHKAALIRAYRTLAQGLAASTVTTALVALVSGLGVRDALVALGTTLVTALASFWAGIAKGLPEAVEEVED